MADMLRLGDYTIKIGSGATPRGGKESYLSAGPYSLIRSQNVYNDGFSHGGLAYISEDQARALRNVEVHALDVLVNITGDSVARVCQVDPLILPARVNQHVAIVRPDNKNIDATFLRYWLVSPKMQERLLALASAGATRPALTKSMLEGLTVPAIKLGEQQTIANILSILDGKIGLNRRTIDTMEGMARAIFQDWFVNFSPVRRKLEGATDPVVILGGLIVDPAQAARLVDLFPTTIDAQGLPLGWTRSPLQTLLNLAYGKALPKTVRMEGHVPVYGSGGIGGTHNSALVTGPGVIVGRKGTVGSLFWEPNNFYPIDTVFFVQPKPNVSLNFLWQLLQTLGLETMNTDAAVPGLNRNNVHRLEVVRATQPILDAFHDLASVLRSAIDANEAENSTLAETRDYLLPRLMNGSIHVADAQRMVR